MDSSGIVIPKSEDQMVNGLAMTVLIDNPSEVSFACKWELSYRWRKP